MTAPPNEPHDQDPQEGRGLRFLTDEAESSRRADIELNTWRHEKAEPQLDRLDKWRGKAERQLDGIVTDVDTLKTTVVAHSKRFDELDKKLDKTRDELDKKLDLVLAEVRKEQ